MSFLPVFEISSAGLQVQKIRMDLASTNLANAQTTHGPDGTAYRRQIPVFNTDKAKFDNELSKQGQIDLEVPVLSSITKDQTDLKQVYDPSHPDATPDGYVLMPNVNLVREMSDLLMASRAYEANVTAFNSSKGLALKTLEIGKV